MIIGSYHVETFKDSTIPEYMAVFSQNGETVLVFKSRYKKAIPEKIKLITGEDVKWEAK